MTHRQRVALVLGLLLSCGLAVVLASVYTWEPLQERQENARLKAELLHEQEKLRVLRGLVDTLKTPAPRPAPARPPIFNT